MANLSANQLLLGIDIGTQAVKALAVTPRGRIAHRASIERAPRHPHPGWVEMDTERDLWGAVLRVIHDLIDDGMAGESVQVIGVTGMVPCLTPINGDGKAVGPTILYSDNRALEELDWVNEKGGLKETAQAVVPKLVWLRNHRPTDFEQIRTVLSAHNYVVFRLSGERYVDYDTSSIFGGVFDKQKRDWAVEMCRSLDLDPALFPSAKPATALVGAVTAQAAAETGLPRGIPVMAGTGDTFATMLGCGVIDPGDGMVAFGTTGLLTLTQRPLVESASGPHFDDGSGTASVAWVANVLSAGRLVRWFVDVLGRKEAFGGGVVEGSPYAKLEVEAGRVPAGGEGLIVLPHWLGRRTPSPDPNLRGAMVGFTPSHTLGHIYRAILESFAYNQRQTFAAVRPQIQRLVATAGGARSRLWRQIVTDVLNMPMEYYPAASGALGIAFLAGHASGLIADFNAVKRDWLRDPEISSPDPVAVASYNGYFEVYCEVEAQLTAPFEHLARLATA